MAKSKKTSNYNYETDLQTMKIPEMLKQGFKAYVEIKNITIGSEKDLQNELKKFKQQNAGE